MRRSVLASLVLIGISARAAADVLRKSPHHQKSSVPHEKRTHNEPVLAVSTDAAPGEFLVSHATHQLSVKQQDAAAREAVDRPKLSAGCAGTSTSLVAGAAVVAMAAAWFAILKGILAKDIPEGGDTAPRLAVLDTCKFLLMIPVICQHTTFWFGPTTLQGAMQFVHYHTRTFCFVSGLTAQGLPSERSIKSVVFRLIAPTMLWSLVGFAYFDRDILKNRSGQAQLNYLFQAFIMAPGISWYMYALVCWRIGGWALMSFKPVTRVVVSVLIMIMSGYIIDSPGFVRNAGVYMPIFVAGQLFPLKELIARVPTVTAPMVLAGAAALLAVAWWEFSAAGLAFLVDIPFYSWGRIEGPADGYCSVTAFSTFWMRGLFRNFLEVSKGLVMILFLLPRSDNMLSRMGQYSLYTYLLHPWAQDFMNEALRMHEWRPHPTASSSVSFTWLCVFGAVAYAFAMNVVLTSYPIRVVFGPILEPAWLERLLAAESKDAKASQPLTAPKAA